MLNLDETCRTPSRRNFVAFAVAYGLVLTYPGHALAKLFQRVDFKLDPYSGSLSSVLHRLTLNADAGILTQFELASEIAKRIAEIHAEVEFAQWIEELENIQSTLPSNQGSFSSLYQSSKSARKPYLGLFYIPDGTSHAPHGHHNLVSVQTVIAGNLHLREYDRVKALEPGLVFIEKVRNVVLKEGEQVLTSDLKNNIHWFGAEKGPAILLNCSVSLRTGPTFYPRGSNKKARIYLDPTVGEHFGDYQVAKEAETAQQIEAHLDKFEGKKLSEFPY